MALIRTSNNLLFIKRADFENSPTLCLISGNQIELTFEALDIECLCSNCPNNVCNVGCDDATKCTDCRLDYVSVFDGTSTSDKLLGTFCGISIPAALTSSNQNLFVMFVSDNKYNRMGFSVTYKTVVL